MAQALQAIGQFVLPMPLVRLAGSAARATAGALARVRGWRGTPSVPPVSAAWLAEHEISSAKRRHW